MSEIKFTRPFNAAALSGSKLTASSRKKDALKVSSATQKIRNSVAVDLAFVFDATSSMSPWIEKAKNNALLVAQKVKEMYPCATLRYALVAYRDYDDSPRCEVMDFVTDVQKLKWQLGKTKATGGADTAEDVALGLKKATELSWRATTRCLCWVADAPAHGSIYHEPKVSDNHKGGDKEGLDPRKLVRKLRSKRIQMHFFRINSSTDKMIRVLRPSYDRGGIKLTQHELGDDPKLFLAETVSSISQSVSVTVDSSRLLSLGRGKRSKKTMTRALAALPEDSAASDPAPSAPAATLQRATPPAWNDPNWGSVEVVDIYAAEHGAKKPEREDVKIRVYKTAFARGATRAAFWVRFETTGEVRVLKEGVYEGTRLNSRQAVFGDLDAQSVAMGLASTFNGECRARGMGAVNFNFVPATVFFFKERAKAGDFERQWCVVESYLRGKYRKLNSNGGWLDLSDDAKLSQAFTHWSWQQTAGDLMVCDLQGVVDNNEGTFVSLTDPQLHTRCGARFGSGNLGLDGMARFFATHKCDGHCSQLGLRMPGESMEYKPMIAVPEPIAVFAPPVPDKVKEEQCAVPKIPPEWVPDSEFFSCQGCHRPFKFYRRRHHCRACGNVLCGRCCDTKMPLPFTEWKPVRVCKQCVWRMQSWKGKGVE